MLAESYVHKLANACNHRCGVMIFSLRRLHDLVIDLDLDQYIDRDRVSQAFTSAVARTAKEYGYAPGLHREATSGIESFGITKLADLLCLAATGLAFIPRKRVWETTEIYERRLVTLFTVFVHLLINRRVATRKEVRSAADRFMRDWGKHMTDPRKILIIADRLRHLSHRVSDQQKAMQALLESLHDFDGSPDDLEFEAIATASLSPPEEAS